MAVRKIGSDLGVPGDFDAFGDPGLLDVPARMDHLHQFWSPWEPIAINTSANWAAQSGATLTGYPPARVCKSADLLMLDLAVRGNFATSAVVGTLPVGFRPADTFQELLNVHWNATGGAPFVNAFTECFRIATDGTIYRMFDDAPVAPSGVDAYWFCQGLIFRWTG